MDCKRCRIDCLYEVTLAPIGGWESVTFDVTFRVTVHADYRRLDGDRCRGLVDDDGWTLYGCSRVGQSLRRRRTFGDKKLQATLRALMINHASETQVMRRQDTNRAEGELAAFLGLFDGVDRDGPSTRRQKLGNPLIRPLAGVQFASRHRFQEGVHQRWSARLRR